MTPAVDESLRDAGFPFPEVWNLLTPATLRLKLGAMVMFTVNKNDSGRRAR